MEQPEEQPAEQNPHSTVPLGQNSIIPLKWKPSIAEPVPVVRCTQIKKNGDRCGRWSLRGYDKCISHAGPGARMPDGNVNKYREAVIEAAKLRLLDSADGAIDTLEILMQPGSGEGIRLKAATEILDRAGVRGGFEVNVEQEVFVSAADQVKDRLAKLSAGAKAVDEMRKKTRASDDDDSDSDIVEAEIVSEDEEQLPLFDLDTESQDSP